MSGLDLGLCADADVLVAEIESDCEECDRDNYACDVSVVGSPLFTDDDRHWSLRIMINNRRAAP